MLIIQHHGTNTPISYKHVVKPIGSKESGFSPNWEQYNKIKATSLCNILPNDFERVQNEGKIILINSAGGWCDYTYGMDILEGANLIE